ncbi:MAG: ATP-binding protein, partial [Bdellovibrionales bacterium]|nr:ATP-binding protein [Bdellovibrionales bacterium]
AYRKTFCAFANTRGGHLIVGVEEKKNKSGRPKGYQVIGCGELSEINTEISQLIDDHVDFPIPNWNIHPLELSTPNRFVHFIEVPASPSYRKPHMFDEKVFYRLPGRSVHAKDGPKVREIIEADMFSPGGSHAFEDFCELFKRTAGQLEERHERYYLNMGKFLRYHSEKHTEVLPVYQSFQELERARGVVRRSQVSSYSVGEGGVVDQQGDPLAAVDSQSEAFDSFAEQFRSVLGGLK